MSKSIFEYIVQQQKDRRPFALATMIETRGSVSARTAAKALIKEALIESILDSSRRPVPDAALPPTSV